MPTCREIEERLAPFVDGELPTDARAEIEGHLEECPPCRDAARAQAGCRELLRARGARLRAAAPDRLVARCSALQCGASRARRRLWIPTTLAASLLFALSGVALYGLTGVSGRLLAAQLALDHLKCRTFPGESRDTAQKPSDAAAHFARAYGWNVAVPAAPPGEGARFICLRRCLYMRGQIAHAVYHVDESDVSLFVLPSAESPPVDLSILGQRARTWSDGHRTYALIADLPPDAVARLKRYFEPRLVRARLEAAR
jgi:anti-sigma factor RsiW